MSLMEALLPIGPYHWLLLALILFGLEMVTNTIDLLWISIAAVVAALVAWLAPESIGLWQGQLIAFIATSIALVFAGRTVFAGLRKPKGGDPKLNQRMVRLEGKRGTTVDEFSGGVGRVKIGDTVWSAEASDSEASIGKGTQVIVEASRSTTVLVRPL